MKQIFLLFLLCSASMYAQTYQKTVSGIKADAHGNSVEIQFYTPSIVRVVKTPQGKVLDKPSLSVILSPSKTSVKTNQQGNTITVASNKIKVAVDLATGGVAFSSASGQELLKEKANSATFTSFNDIGTATYKVSQSFILDQNEPIYGLGQHQTGTLSQRNQKYRLEQGNVEDAITFIQSIKGYGLFWDNYSITEFSDDTNGTTFESQVGDGVDYYFMYGGNADGVIANMRELTGQAPLFPLWTYGYWQSRERYKSQAEVIDVVKKYRELGVPIDGIIQDWQYWGNNYLWNSMEFLNVEFPDGKKMVKDVHDLNAHIIISIWSSFGPHTKQYRDMDAKGMLYNIRTWPESGSEIWPPRMDYPSGVRVYDAYNPEARDMYWDYASRGLFSTGMDGWWMDSTEPDHFYSSEADYETKTFMGSFRKVRNAYPLMAVGGVYDHQRKETSNKRVFILTRSAFAGQQRYGANTWSGDTSASWDTFRKQIPAGLNFSLSGIPHWNADIGGFFAGSYKQGKYAANGALNPLYQELYVRWLQFGAFTPMMRSHGTEVPREIYQFGKKGEPIFDAIDKFINLRYTLLPYIYSTSWQVSANSSSFMRALFMDFASDKKAWDVNNEYMFGKSILVAPVVKAQYTPETAVNVNEQTGWDKQSGGGSNTDQPVDFSAEKTVQVYLPAGTDWFDFWTGKKLNGGQEIAAKTTIDMIPLYIKAGSILPIAPKVQYAEEKKWDDLEVKVYPGADGTFVLYEDEFDNYNYEKGAYTEITFTWDDSSKKLTINNRKGTYNGMLQNRKFNVVLPSGEKKTVAYSGKKTVVTF